MSRATIVLAVVVVALLAGLVALSRRSADVPLRTIETPVTVAGNGA